MAACRCAEEADRRIALVLSVRRRPGPSAWGSPGPWPWWSAVRRAATTSGRLSGYLVWLGDCAAVRRRQRDGLVQRVGQEPGLTIERLMGSVRVMDSGATVAAVICVVAFTWPSLPRHDARPAPATVLVVDSPSASMLNQRAAWSVACARRQREHQQLRCDCEARSERSAYWWDRPGQSSVLMVGLDGGADLSRCGRRGQCRRLGMVQGAW